MSASDTPRTDAFLKQYEYPSHSIPGEFMRQLERDLAVANERIERAERERDAARDWAKDSDHAFYEQTHEVERLRALLRDCARRVWGSDWQQDKRGIGTDLLERIRAALGEGGR